MAGSSAADRSSLSHIEAVTQKRLQPTAKQYRHARGYSLASYIALHSGSLAYIHVGKWH